MALKIFKLEKNIWILRIEGGNRLNGSIDISGAKTQPFLVIASTIYQIEMVHSKNIPNVGRY